MLCNSVNLTPRRELLMPLSFAIACKRFFGTKEGQTLKDFAEELKTLTPSDRDELAALLAVELEDIVIP